MRTCLLSQTAQAAWDRLRYKGSVGVFARNSLPRAASVRYGGLHLCAVVGPCAWPAGMGGVQVEGVCVLRTSQTQTGVRYAARSGRCIMHLYIILRSANAHLH